jgi:hypothetical protein
MSYALTVSDTATGSAPDGAGFWLYHNSGDVRTITHLTTLLLCSLSLFSHIRYGSLLWNGGLRADISLCLIFSLLGAGLLTMGSRIIFGGWVFGDSTHTGVYLFGVWQLLVFCGSFYWIFSFLRAVQLFLPNFGMRGGAGLAGVAVLPERVGWLFFSLLLVCWAPYLLSLYPGIITPDTITSVSQAKGDMPLQNDHPLAFTYLLVPFIGGDWDINWGTFGFSIFLTFLTAGALSYCLCWLKKGRAGDIPVLLSLSYFCLMPVFPIYAVTVQKDTLFTISVLLLSLMATDAVAKYSPPSLRRQIVLAALSLAVIYLRHNGLYVAIALFFAMGWWAWRDRWLGRWAGLVGVVGVMVLLLGFPLFNIGKKDTADAYSIPLQQLSRKIFKDYENRGGVTGLKISGEAEPMLYRPLSKDDSVFMANVIPLEFYRRYYIPTASDTIKVSDSFNHQFFNDNKNEFLSLWMRNLPDNLGVYADAHTLQTFGFWMPQVKSHFGFMDISCDPTYRRPGVKYEMGGSLYDFRRTDLIERMTGSNFMQQLLHRRGFFGGGSLVWAGAAGIFLVLSMKRRKMLMLFIPAFAVWGTVVLSTPNAVSLRYILIFAYALPVFLAAAFLTISNDGQDGGLEGRRI